MAYLLCVKVCLFLVYMYTYFKINEGKSLIKTVGKPNRINSLKLIILLLYLKIKSFISDFTYLNPLLLLYMFLVTLKKVTILEYFQKYYSWLPFSTIKKDLLLDKYPYNHQLL